jgi:alpha-L-rhamnosidase
MNKREEPGYGRWLELGSTTTREHWSTSGSHNHPMFGGGLVWYYRQLAGMNADSNQPGYKHIIFKPQPAGDLTYVKYFNETSYGKAGIHWEKKDGQFTMQVEVPVGCSATVYVPLTQEKTVLESGKPVSDLKEIELLKDENGYRLLKVGSGTYEFLSL